MGSESSVMRPLRAPPSVLWVTDQGDFTLNPHGGCLWRPPHAGVPEIVGRQSQPPRWMVLQKVLDPNTASRMGATGERRFLVLQHEALACGTHLAGCASTPVKPRTSA
ncbi:MAG: hypothetical protein PHH58_12835 [Rhodoferax sp.]|nr:hypothetical protein [Rhodoferax sp.]